MASFAVSRLNCMKHEVWTHSNVISAQVIAFVAKQAPKQHAEGAGSDGTGLCGLEKLQGAQAAGVITRYSAHLLFSTLRRLQHVIE